ncbi:unnamed protein product [Lactuca virosa]|uniref:Uncharacterized protein n=1 Tax=Lactuca virosa TaxID=75947 RepID=A0AAU9MFW5_9ASTR|nr:unnamed protein product [Lactuca virosa]
MSSDGGFQLMWKKGLVTRIAVDFDAETRKSGLKIAAYASPRISDGEWSHHHGHHWPWEWSLAQGSGRLYFIFSFETSTPLVLYTWSYALTSLFIFSLFSSHCRLLAPNPLTGSKKPPSPPSFFSIATAAALLLPRSNVSIF